MSDFRLHLGDCLEVMQTFPDNHFSAIVCDPPYMIDFMGKSFDTSKNNIAASVELWAEALRVAKPGAHLLAFGGDRTHHRLMCAIEDAGWELRTCLYWCFSQGFPKSHDVSKAIDKHGGKSVGWFGPWFREWRRQRGISSNDVAKLFPSKTGGETGCVRNWELGFNMPTPEQFNTICQTFGLPFESLEEAEREVIGQQRQGRLAVAPGQGMDRSAVTLDITAPATDAAKQWLGWGSALKPAVEIIILARAPLSEPTIAANVLKHGTGAINVDACRVEGKPRTTHADGNKRGQPGQIYGNGKGLPSCEYPGAQGRWPSNLCLDPEAAALLDQMSGERPSGSGNKSPRKHDDNAIYGKGLGYSPNPSIGGDSGGASRFFANFAHDDEPLRMFYAGKASAKDRSAGLDGLGGLAQLRADLTEEQRTWVYQELERAGVDISL